MDISNVDYGAARFWMDFLQVAAILALGVYQHITNKAKANASAIELVKDDYDDLKDRVAAVEGQLKNAPTHQDISKVYDRLNDVAGDLSGALGQMRGLSHQLSMVNQYLLNNKGDQGR